MATPYSLKKKQQIQKAMEQALSAAASKPATQGTPFASAATEAAYAASNPSYKVPIETTTTKKVAGATKNVSQEKKDKVYSSFPGYTKKRAEETKAEAEKAKSAVEEAEGQEFDWTDANQRKQHEEAVKQKKVEAAKADEKARQAQKNAVFAEDMVEINTMSEEERAALQTYADELSNTNASRLSGGNLFADIFSGSKMDQAEKVLSGKYDRDRLKELAETLNRVKNEEETKKAEAAGKEAGGGGVAEKTLGTLGTFGTNLVGTATGIAGYATELMGSTGRYPTLDPNNPGNIPNKYSAALRGQIVQDVRGEGDSALRNAAAYAYQAATETVDNLLRIAVAGPAALGLAAVGSFGQTLAEASEKGATPEQAVLQATANAALEVMTEKIPLDNLLKTMKGGKQTAGQIVKGALAQAGIEATSEEINFVAQLMAESAILQEKSGYNQRIGDMVANGMSYQEAKEAAQKELWEQAKQTAIVSGLSGGLSQAGTSVATNLMTPKVQTAPVAQNVPQLTPESGEAVQGVPQLVPDAGQEAQAVAQQPHQKQAGQTSMPLDSRLLETVQQAEQAVKSPDRIALERAMDEVLGNEPQEAQGVQKAETAVERASTLVEEFGRIMNEKAPQKVQREEKSPERIALERAMDEVFGNAPQDINQSKTFTNTGLNNASQDVKTGYTETMAEKPDAANYQVKHRADTLQAAQNRVSTPELVDAEYSYLMEKPSWNADDVATANLLQDRIMKSGEPDAAQKFAAFAEKKKQIGSIMGQAIDAFRIQEGTMQAANSPATAVDSFYNALDAMQEKATTFKQRKNGPDFKQWKKQIKENVARIGVAIEMVDDGDTGAMRDIIRQIAKERKTTAWFGISDRLSWNANRVLNKLGFEDLKTIANAQVAAMSDDYRARTTGDIIAGIRKQNMLTSIKTIKRNLYENSFGGLLDSASDSTAGQMVDILISEITGQRTVSNDFKNAKAYAKGASEAADFASLCVELSIPIETDAAGAYASATGEGGGGKYIGKTFRANGNVAMRAMYAYQKYMSYSLEVSDKIFEGGTNAAVAESLQRLKHSGLSDQQISDISEFAANRRTFKDATWTDENGKIHGSDLSRILTAVKKGHDILPDWFNKGWQTATDIAVPFASVPMNVTQTGIDYTAGVVKGIGEVASIIKDAKQGKPINAVRQRKAATDFGRGLTGVGMISLFAAAAIQGAIKVTNPDDWDEEALMQSEGKTGAQINWNALERGMKGESAEWKAGDAITSLDFLESYNTQIYLGYELAQADDIKEAFKQYPGATIRSVFNSLMDSPMMDGPERLLETIQEVMESETAQDGVNALASYAGDVASSFIPQVVRQAAQYSDGYYRDTRGATPVETAMNRLKAAIPGFSQNLPIKYNALGEPQERGGFSSIFLDPTNTMEYQPNEVTTYLEDLRTKLPDDVGFIPDRQSPMSITVNGIERVLDGTQRETYQKTYGEKVSEYYSALIKNQDFGNLSPELQAEALKRAEQYATSFAKAAVSEYKEVPEEATEELTKNIVRDTVLNSITDIFTDLNIAEEYGYDQKEHEAALDAAYQQFRELSNPAQADAREEATGNTSRYLEVRDNGISQDAYLAASREVENVKGTGTVNKDTGKANVRDIDKREAVSRTSGLSEKEVDTIMHAYMSDYDPDDSSPELTEVKYDYIRQVLGLSPEGYAETYRAHLDNDKKNDKIDAMVELGYSRDVATKLYKIYGGDSATKQAMLEWYQ